MTGSHYPTLDPNPRFPDIEEQVLKFWREENLFARSVEARPAQLDGKNNEFIFYDGPPFANGLPHYGHLLTGYVKDAVARYQTMRGKRVERRFGWDCHGLPAEMATEKELGISGRLQILDYGIGKFNEYCRTSVMRYTKEWEDYVTRQARWVDFRNDYKTMDKSFMESVLWAFSELYKKGLIYESFRVMPYSWAAETPVSNFETRIDNATREREDKAAYVAFKLKTKPEGLAPECSEYNIIAWTTTPWTLPSNMALAVNEELEYYCHRVGNKGYIATSDALFKLFGVRYGIPNNEVPYTRIENLIGTSYEPLFPYFTDREKTGAFRILNGSDFVSAGDGTGIVHIAPGFGEDDQRVGAKNNIPLVAPVDGQGLYTDEIFDLPDLKLRGLNVIADTRLEESDRVQHIAEKDVEKYGLANMRILRWLKAHGALVKDEPYKHNYPHCWRTDTPLIYKAMSSWYVNIQKIKDRMAANNREINWIPDHVQNGQMGKGIESAPDWSISRNRFWGTPIPIWRSDNPNSKEPIKVFGSIAELEAFFGAKIEDLHRPYIDELTAPDGEGYRYARVEDVFDCWFESGSMPFAQLHYPFENKEKFEANFPADFITEYVAQTRGWFYTLQVLSAALFDCAPFKNCICHGVVIDEETGLKYSKRLKNYRDPREVMDAFGADALRWMMLSSPVMRGMDLSVDPDGKFIRDVVRLSIKPIWNAYNFFCLYANADGVKASFSLASTHLMDRYILSKAAEAVTKAQGFMDAYDTPSAAQAITRFFDVLNNWYIRRSKERFWKAERDADKQQAYDTLYTVLHLLVRTAAPLLPLTAEAIFSGLNGGEYQAANSVHLADYPGNDVASYPMDAELIADMDRVQDICNTALGIRNENNLRVRLPLQEISIVTRDASAAEQWRKKYGTAIADIIKEEINVKSLGEGGISLDQYATLSLSINSAALGKRLPAKMKEILPASKKGEWKTLPDGNVEIAGERLNEGEFTLRLEPKPEYKGRAQALSTNDALVILDTTMTPELEREGMARDMVRMIQQARKDAGLDVSDRILLGLEASADMQAAVAEHQGYITEQTLSNSLVTEISANAEHRFEQMLDGQRIVITLSKAA